MTISDLIMFAANRAALLSQQRDVAVFQGNVERIEKLDAEIAETQNTLDKLRSLA